MRRRLTLAMVLMVMGTLVVSGLVSLALVQISTRNQTRNELVREAQSFGATVTSQAQTTNPSDPTAALRNELHVLKAPLHLDGSAVFGIFVKADGTPVVFDPVTGSRSPILPSGVSLSNLSVTGLAAMQPESGIIGGLAYAAYPYPASARISRVDRSVVQVIILTRRPPSALRSAGPWFLLSSVVILVVAALVARAMGRRFVRPIRAAQQVTGQIAAGDLGARVPEGPDTDPELAGLANSINAMAASLAQAKGVERQFFQSVSHDLRTPLTSIRGFAEAIEDGATEDVTAAAGVIASEARRLERLVADLLGLATLEAKRFTLQIQPLDLTTAAADAAAGFIPSASELGLALYVDSSGPIGVNADPDRLAQVAANLIENALKYASHEVHVGAVQQGATAALWVADDGPGIAPADLDRVFERLYVSRPQSGRSIGTGLGLAIVAELVSAMGGQVRAESPIIAGGGTRMVVSFPSAALVAPPLPLG